MNYTIVERLAKAMKKDVMRENLSAERIVSFFGGKAFWPIFTGLIGFLSGMLFMNFITLYHKSPFLIFS